MPTFSPIDDQVLIRRAAAVEMQGKLHVPGRAVEKPLEGVVVAVGPGRMVRGLPSAPLEAVADAGDTPPDRRWTALLDLLRTTISEHRVPCQLRPGQRVLFRKYGGTDVQLDDTDCIVVREGEVLGVIEEDAPRLLPPDPSIRNAIAAGDVGELNLDRELTAAEGGWTSGPSPVVAP